MTRFKRLLAVLLIAAMALPLLAGCWGGTPDPSTWTIENGTLIVPNGVTHLTKTQIEKVSGSFTAVILPDSLTSIGDRTFEGNTALTSVTFGSSTDAAGRTTLNPATGWINFTALASAAQFSRASRSFSIGRRAFYGCTNLITVSGWEKITSIGASAFQNTSIRGEINLSNVTSIGASAFEGCIEITVVTVPSGASVDDNAFSVNVTINVTNNGSNSNPGGSTSDDADDEETNGGAEDLPTSADVQDVEAQFHVWFRNLGITVVTNSTLESGISSLTGKLTQGSPKAYLSSSQQSFLWGSLYRGFCESFWEILDDFFAAYSSANRQDIQDILSCPALFSGDLSKNEVLPTFKKLSANDDAIKNSIKDAEAAGHQVHAICHVEYAVSDTDPTDRVWVVYFSIYEIGNSVGGNDSVTAVRTTTLEKFSTQVLTKAGIEPIFRFTASNFDAPTQNCALEIFSSYNDASSTSQSYDSILQGWAQQCADSIGVINSSSFHTFFLLSPNPLTATLIGNETQNVLGTLENQNYDLSNFQYFVRVYKVSNSTSEIYLLMGFLYDPPTVTPAQAK